MAQQINEDQVKSLQTDLAAKAPLASPALTGTPTAPTATAGTNTTQLATTAFVTAAVAAATPTIPLSIGFVVPAGAGTTGTNVGPEFSAKRAGSFTKCVVVTRASDASTALTFRIKQNGTDIFTADPSIAAGTAAGTRSTFTALTATPLPVAYGDLFTLDITSGSASWAVTIQLE